MYDQENLAYKMYKWIKPAHWGPSRRGRPITQWSSTCLNRSLAKLGLDGVSKELIDTAVMDKDSWANTIAELNCLEWQESNLFGDFEGNKVGNFDLINLQWIERELVVVG